MGNQKDLLYSTGNSAQSYVAASMGGEFGEERIHALCMAESLCYSPEVITTLFIDYIPIQNSKVFFFLKRGIGIKEALR